MALEFQLPGGGLQHMTMLNTPMFGAARPQTFLDLMVAITPDPATGKPDPEGYLLAAKRLGVPPEACAVIEDSPTGARAAKAAGMLTIAWPQSAEHVFEEVDHLVEHPSEVDWHGLIEA